MDLPALARAVPAIHRAQWPRFLLLLPSRRFALAVAQPQTANSAVSGSTAAMHMQRAMGQFAQVSLPGGQTVSLAMKVAVATGPVKRFQVGDRAIQFLDVMAGDVMERV